MKKRMLFVMVTVFLLSMLFTNTAFGSAVGYNGNGSSYYGYGQGGKDKFEKCSKDDKNNKYSNSGSKNNDDKYGKDSKGDKGYCHDDDDDDHSNGPCYDDDKDRKDGKYDNRDRYNQHNYDKGGKDCGNPGKSGTTLSAEVTAKGFRTMNKAFDWTITKDSDVDRPVIDKNHSYVIQYTLQTVRSATYETERAGVKGIVKVTNGGSKSTQGLRIVPQVEYKTGSGQFAALSGASVTITPDVQLQPGQSKTYPYEIQFTPISGAQYRVSAKVTITNHSGHLNVPFGPEPKQGFSLPASYQLTTEDATASVTDTPECPSGFTCTASQPGPWNLIDGGSITYTVTLTNNSAPALQIIPFKNTATLTESTTGQVRNDDNTVSIFTGCGCTVPK